MDITFDNLWETPKLSKAVVVVTTCGIIHDTKSPRLVMGAGCAKEALRYHPMLPYWAAEEIMKNSPFPEKGIYYYGFIPMLLPMSTVFGIGIFQTKANPGQPSRMDIIKNSATDLAAYCQQNPDFEIRLAFPSVGLGNLDPWLVFEIIYPTLEKYNVTLYRKR